MIQHDVPATTALLDKAAKMSEAQLDELSRKIWDSEDPELTALYESFIHHGDAEFTKHPMFERVKQMYFNAYV